MLGYILAITGGGIRIFIIMVYDSSPILGNVCPYFYQCRYKLYGVR